MKNIKLIALLGSVLVLFSFLSCEFAAKESSLCIQLPSQAVRILAQKLLNDTPSDGSSGSSGTALKLNTTQPVYVHVHLFNLKHSYEEDSSQENEGIHKPLVFTPKLTVGSDNEISLTPVVINNVTPGLYEFFFDIYLTKKDSDEAINIYNSENSEIDYENPPQPIFTGRKYVPKEKEQEWCASNSDNFDMKNSPWAVEVRAGIITKVTIALTQNPLFEGGDDENSDGELPSGVTPPIQEIVNLISSDIYASLVYDSGEYIAESVGMKKDGGFWLLQKKSQSSKATGFIGVVVGEGEKKSIDLYDYDNGFVTKNISENPSTEIHYKILQIKSWLTGKSTIIANLNLDTSIKVNKSNIYTIDENDNMPDFTKIIQTNFDIVPENPSSQFIGYQYYAGHDYGGDATNTFDSDYNFCFYKYAQPDFNNITTQIQKQLVVIVKEEYKYSVANNPTWSYYENTDSEYIWVSTEDNNIIPRSFNISDNNPKPVGYLVTAANYQEEEAKTCILTANYNNQNVTLEVILNKYTTGGESPAGT
ncbi:MAG: hypothetical protein GX220_02810 [Treponema sp.]|nr:hypothetical protein [Treponema sp.]